MEATTLSLLPMPNSGPWLHGWDSVAQISAANAIWNIPTSSDIRAGLAGRTGKSTLCWASAAALEAHVSLTGLAPYLLAQAQIQPFKWHYMSVFRQLSPSLLPNNHKLPESYWVPSPQIYFNSQFIPFIWTLRTYTCKTLCYFTVVLQD